MAYLKTFEPLRITATFRNGVLADDYFPLEGILLYQASRLACGVEQVTIPGGGVSNRKDIKKNVSVPLLIINPNTPDWYFSCSWAYPCPWWLGEGIDYWNKRFDSQFSDLIDFEKRRGKVIIGSGKNKAYHMPLYYRLCKSVSWYCVGDYKRVVSLLSTITHLGKKSSQGWGRVIRWEIDPIKEDYSVWKDSQLMRGIPAKDAEGKGMFNLAHYGVRPPYYRSKNQMLLAMP